MRTTLQKIGLSENDFIKTCDASLKQGTKFVGWHSGDGETYYHPFSLPQKFGELDLAYYWQQGESSKGYAHSVSPQPNLCDQDRAAKQVQTPEYAFNVNYGYHLNAGKFADLLKTHCVDKLGVAHVSDHVTGLNSGDDGSIQSLNTRENGELDGDFFVDCSGLASLLLGQHFGSEVTEVGDELFNNTALAAQVPYADPQAEITSTTVATAQESGWIWDIGLSSRRGIGYVYSSNHCSDDQAEQTLRSYLSDDHRVANADDVSLRQIKFQPGYRKQPFKHNCLAIGLSAGFVEPLEASALVLVERSAFWLAENLPPKRDLLGITEQRFNQRFQEHWRSIVDFLKLHYVTSHRGDAYWRDHREATSISDSLANALKLWQFRSPDLRDAPHYDELFPAASYQYVLSGMQYPVEYTALNQSALNGSGQMASKTFADIAAKSSHMAKMMPGNREFLNQIYQGG